MSPAIISKRDSVDVRVNPGQGEDALIDLAQAAPANLIGDCRALIGNLWQRRPRYNIESMYKRDDRESTTSDPLKPTTLTGQLIADIWLLNSKR